jgi:hypothetical protein
MDQSDAVLELRERYSQHYPDPARPVHSKLMEAYVARLVRLLEIAPASGSLADWLSILPELHTITSELRDLRSYLGENPLFVPMPRGRLGDFLMEQGFSFEQAQDALELAAMPPRGRPPSARMGAVVAFEMRRSRRLSWRRIAMEICPCREDRHGHSCSERIRQAVMDLQDTLARYNIPLP